MSGCQWARMIQIALVSLAVLLSSCSGHSFEKVSIQGIPVPLIGSRAVRSDVSAIAGVAQQQVQRRLPHPYLNAFVYASRCDALLELEGKFNMQFAQIRGVLLWRRHLTADVSIETESSTMDIEYLDYTGLDLRVNGLTFETTEVGFGEVVRIAHDYILASTEQDCDVTITRTKEAWFVRCGPLEDFTQECSFQIDPWTGMIGLGEE